MDSPFLKDIPGYERAIRAARQRETSIRVAPFLPQDRRVHGIPILPLTLGHYLLLSLLGSPLLHEAEVEAIDILHFLWIVSPDYCGPGPHTSRAACKIARSAWLARHRQRILRALKGKGGVAAVTKRLRAEVDEALYDCPRSASDSPNSHAVTMAASVLDEFAAEYSWSREAISATPLSILMQMRRAGALRKHPGAILSSPSDRAGILVVRRHNARQAKRKARPSTQRSRE